MSSKFKFAQFVIVDGRIGQIIDYFGNGWYMVDFKGLWIRTHENEIKAYSHEQQ